MLTIGLKSEDMICTSVPSTKIPSGEEIFDYLNKALNDEISVLFFQTSTIRLYDTEVLEKTCLFSTF